MATAGEAPKEAAVVPHQGDHDRLTMLSVKADGTLDQHNPELIGDKEAALAATARQFAEQAVSAVDVAERGVTAGPAVTLVGQADGSTVAEPLHDPAHDPVVADLKEKQDKAAKAAEKQAAIVVAALHQG